ncbi:MAG: nucleotidyltransferase domain-containing protein [Longimicrobiales bacterium]
MDDCNNELRMLLACACAQLSTAGAGRIRELLDEQLHWPSLLTLSARHGMLPLMTAHLGPFAERLPESVRARLAASEIENTRRLLQLTRELLAVLRQFRNDGIPAAPYKGPILSLQLYGSLALRQAADLDVVIRDRDVERARILLTAGGYRREHELTSSGEAFMVRSRYSETYRHPDGFWLELHWAFTNRDFAFPLTFDSLAPGLGGIELGGEDVPVFAWDDLLILLCVHGAKHRWDRLELICGVAETMRRLHAADWPRVMQRAVELGAWRMLALGILLSHASFALPLPAHVVRQCRSDDTVARLCAQVRARLGAPRAESEAPPLETDIFHYRLRERRRDRLRFLLYRLTTPSNPERWSVLTLAGRAIPLHAFVRPFQLLKKSIPALRTHLARQSRSN